MASVYIQAPSFYAAAQRVVIPDQANCNTQKWKDWTRGSLKQSPCSHSSSREAKHIFIVNMAGPTTDVAFTTEIPKSSPFHFGGGPEAYLPVYHSHPPPGPTPAPAPSDISLNRTALEIYLANIAYGQAKAKASRRKTFLLGIMAGAYIGLAGLMMCTMGGHLRTLPCGIVKGICALVFPFGLQLVLLNGAEMFTGNTMVSGTAFLAKKITLSGLLKNWGFAFLGNLVGGVSLAALAAAAGLLSAPGVGEFISNVAVTKAVSKKPLQLFLQAIICNALVCLAVQCSTSAKDTTGKIVGLWMPVMAFVAMGVEHSVANMFLIPAGMFAGAAVSVAQMARNLVLVSLGNAIGGMGLIAFSNHLAHGGSHSTPHTTTTTHTHTHTTAAPVNNVVPTNHQVGHHVSHHVSVSSPNSVAQHRL